MKFHVATEGATKGDGISRRASISRVGITGAVRLPKFFMRKLLTSPTLISACLLTEDPITLGKTT